jgi:uncharacterized membrane protein YbhN (UPF0104 family)
MIWTFFNTVLEGRDWSWSLIGIAAIIVGLLLRGLLLTGILKRVRRANRKWYKRTQVYYQENAWMGWIPFGIFAIGSMCFWRFEAFFLKHLGHLEWIIILVSFLALSLFLHLRTYAQAMVDAVQEQVITDKDL